MNRRWIVISIAVILLITIGVVVAKVKKHADDPASHTNAPVSVQKLLQEAQGFQDQGDDLKAKDSLNQILLDHPDYDKIEDIQKRLGDLNIKIIFSRTSTPQTEIYEVQPGDSLGKLSKMYGTTKELIKRGNNLKSDVIRVGEKLRIWKAPFTVYVKKSQNMMTLKSNDEFIKNYQVATGRDKTDNATPTGTFKIASKIPHPVWYKTGSKPIAPEDPANELGTRWMGFAENPHYGIHGTIHPDAIGENATAGCVRMHNSDVEELFDLLPIGTKVIIAE